MLPRTSRTCYSLRAPARERPCRCASCCSTARIRRSRSRAWRSAGGEGWQRLVCPGGRQRHGGDHSQPGSRPSFRADRAFRKHDMNLCRNLPVAAFAFVALVLLALWPEVAAAHQVNLSTARITVRADGIVDVDIAMKGSDVDRVAGTSVYDTQTGLVRPDALTAASARVAGYIV